MKFPYLMITLIFTLAAVLITRPAASCPSGGGGQPPAPSSFDLNGFQKCLLSHSGGHKPGFTLPSDPSFISLLDSTIENTKGLLPNVPKPAAIITPYTETDAAKAVHCASTHGVSLRVRSGGHDYEDLSYTSFMGLPFAVLDLQNLRNVTVDVASQTAWVQAGATVGELYYHAATESGGTLGFPAGICTTIGVAGNFLGGGYGMMMRAYGLAANNVLDARLVTADGNLLSRKSMGEDVFWALRGGGGGSFGVVLAWKVQLVEVPPKVTVFSAIKILDNSGGSKGFDVGALYKWQKVAPVVNDTKLFMRVIMQPAGPTSVVTIYSAMYLGNKADAARLMRNKFRELGLRDADYTEMSWIESVLAIGGFNVSTTKPDYLLKRIGAWQLSFKAKSDMVLAPIPKPGLRKLCQAVTQQSMSMVILTPYGGKMKEIADDATPFPHCDALFMAQYVGQWATEGQTLQMEAQNKKWVSGVYDMMAPYVSSNPRRAYVNYRDLDLGKDDNSCPNCSCPNIWGYKYFNNNFMRLVDVKTKVDPKNFFFHEQSIPTHSTLNNCINLVS
ncbi:FAD-binding Berberine family protein [Striga asiatica]|uniref:FAD-binding Berberine family protein n=1 Tax=Striga asiatica TaxID=4170 RepID=A0A5A7NZY7_STRAF|nr:FAD-binding Berberine family protein [Striga asiatica]